MPGLTVFTVTPCRPSATIALHQDTGGARRLDQRQRGLGIGLPCPIVNRDFLDTLFRQLHGYLAPGAA
jgi:hypothetical protein